MKLLDFQKLTAIYARLSKREKVIFYGTSVVVGFLLLDQLVVGPILGTFDSLDQELSNLQTDISKTMQILSQKEQIKLEAEKYSSFVTQAKSEDEEMNSLLEYIEELANKATVNLLYVKPAGNKTEGITKKFLVTLECEGQSTQIVSFFYALESSPKLLTIEKYSIQPTGSGSSVIKAAATLSRVVVN